LYPKIGEVEFYPVPGEVVANVLGECFDADSSEGSPSAHVGSAEPLVQYELSGGLPAVDVVEKGAI
jgi:hypothetical protein